MSIRLFAVMCAIKLGGTDGISAYYYNMNNNLMFKMD